MKGTAEDEIHVRNEYVLFHVHVHDVFGHDVAISHPLIGVRPEELILPLPVFFYINAKKIVLAQKLLLQNYSPYDVCFMVGYNNYSSFSRRFSKQIGTSPKQFQLSHKESR